MIGPLALRFLADAGRGLGRTDIRAAPELLAALHAYDWPGNVRELKAVIERALLLARGGEVGSRHLAFSPRPQVRPAAPPDPPPPTAAPADGDAAVTAVLTPEQLVDRERVIAALDECVGNQTRAASLLGIARSTLVAKLTLYRIPRPRR
jgi:DNA-binding NtrC family response regulator